MLPILHFGDIMVIGMINKLYEQRRGEHAEIWRIKDG